MTETYEPPVPKSACCHARVYTWWDKRNDPGSSGTTNYYICAKCNQACNVVYMATKISYSTNAGEAKK